MSGDVVHRIPFKSKSNPNNSYECLVYSSGSTSCNCPGWTRRNINGQRECKHTLLVEAMLASGQLSVDGTAPVATSAPFRGKRSNRYADLTAPAVRRLKLD